MTIRFPKTDLTEISEIAVATLEQQDWKWGMNASHSPSASDVQTKFVEQMEYRAESVESGGLLIRYDKKRKTWDLYVQVGEIRDV